MLSEEFQVIVCVDSQLSKLYRHLIIEITFNQLLCIVFSGIFLGKASLYLNLTQVYNEAIHAFRVKYLTG